MIKLEDITVAKAGQKLFEDFSLTLKPKEHYLIQGENGSGKTTLLEIIAGVFTPQSGTITYDFITSLDWEERYRQRHDLIHYVPAHALQAFLRGYHDIFYQQRYYSMGNSAVPTVREIFGEAAHDLAAFNFPANLKVDNLLDLELTRLSNGQLRKVLILRNLIRKIPNVLLFDYPFEGLDRESREELLDLIDHLASSFHIQIILVDHHEEIPSCITHTIRLHNFKIKSVDRVSHGPPPKDLSKFNQDIEDVNSPPVVEVRNLTIQYGEKKIIENLNWLVTKGQRWALTGKNGSGKTTLFSLIFADHPMAYSQQVFLFGKRRGSGESIWDIKKRINYLGPEQIHFMNPHSITDSMRQYILSAKPDSSRRLVELVTFFNAQRYIDLPVRSLSSGQLQMMTLISFFLEEKELLLLDEPFQFLDSASKQRVNEYMNEYLHTDVTLILITHYDEDLMHWTQKRFHL